MKITRTRRARDHPASNEPSSTGRRPDTGAAVAAAT